MTPHTQRRRAIGMHALGIATLWLVAGATLSPFWALLVPLAVVGALVVTFVVLFAFSMTMAEDDD